MVVPCLLLEAIEMELESLTKWKDTHLAKAGRRLQTFLMSTTGKLVMFKGKMFITFHYHVNRHCVVADELSDRIYMIGGVNRRRNTYYYKPSTNSWHSMGNMYYDGYVSKRPE